jgi:hypothetical protein
MRIVLGTLLLLALAAGASAQEGAADPAANPSGTAAPADEPTLPETAPQPASPDDVPSQAPSGDATAQADADTLADCLVQHSGQPESDAMKRVMIAALSDDTPGLKGALSEFSGLLLKLAMSSCGVGLTQLQDPAYGATFQQASSKYGAVLGGKLMQDAFAKLN